jgi:hypothetical protein
VFSLVADIPTEFVLKIPNQEFAPNFPPGSALRRLANQAYALEATWYVEIRGGLLRVESIHFHFELSRCWASALTVGYCRYGCVRDRLPIPQPKGYWSGIESPEDTTKDMGSYGVL